MVETVQGIPRPACRTMAHMHHRSDHDAAPWLKLSKASRAQHAGPWLICITGLTMMLRHGLNRPGQQYMAPHLTWNAVPTRGFKRWTTTHMSGGTRSRKGPTLQKQLLVSVAALGYEDVTGITPSRGAPPSKALRTQTEPTSPSWRWGSTAP